MKIFLRSLMGLLMLAAVCSMPKAHATLVRSMNLQELVGDAEYIVKVKVLDKETQTDLEKSGMIVTFYTFQVQEYLKGTPAEDNQMVITQVAQGKFASPSGKVFRQNLYFPEYEVGKTYLLFLPEAHERTGLLAPVGLQQGVFEIVTKNGQEQIPQLNARKRMLSRNLNQKNARAKFLSTQLNADSSDSSYTSFKSLIQTAGGVK